MKNKVLIIVALGYFLVVNTSYYWQGSLGVLAFPAFFLLLILFVAMAFILVRKTYLLFKAGAVTALPLTEVAVLVIVLTTTVLRPSGIVNFEQFESEPVLISRREGSANCVSTLKLRKNHHFVYSSVCFGITEVKGRFSLRNDTIFFTDVQKGRNVDSFYSFAVIKPSVFSNKNYPSDLHLFNAAGDTAGYLLLITKNELDKLPGSRTGQ